MKVDKIVKKIKKIENVRSLSGRIVFKKIKPETIYYSDLKGDIEQIFEDTDRLTWEKQYLNAKTRILNLFK